MITVAVLIVVLGFALRRAEACTCAPPPPPLEALEWADAVFMGRVVDADTTRDNYPRVTVKIDLEDSWKGDVNGAAVVHTALGGAACGFSFRIGERYLIYASRSEGSFSTNHCTRTASVERAREDLEVLRSMNEGCGSPVGAVSAQIFVFLLVGVGIGRWRGVWKIGRV